MIDIVKKALEVMSKHDIAIIMFTLDKTIVADPDMEEVYEFPMTSKYDVYRELVVRVPFVRMRDFVIIAKRQ